MKRFRWLLIAAMLVALPVIGIAAEGNVADQSTIGELICAHPPEGLSTGGLLSIGGPLLGANCDDAESGVGTLGVEYPDGRWRIR